MDPFIARHVNDPSVIQRSMQHRQGLVFRHVHLVQHAKAAQSGALAHRPLPELHLSAPEGIGADECRRIHIHIHGHIPNRPAKHRCQVLRQDVFARGLRSRQQQMLPTQQSRRRALPNLPSIVEIPWLGNTLRRLLGRRMCLAKPLDLLQQCRSHAFLLQLLKNIHICASPLFHDAVLYTCSP